MHGPLIDAKLSSKPWKGYNSNSSRVVVLDWTVSGLNHFKLLMYININAHTKIKNIYMFVSNSTSDCCTSHQPVHLWDCMHYTIKYGVNTASSKLIDDTAKEQMCEQTAFPHFTHT